MAALPQVVFLGTPGDFSPAPLAALVGAGVPVRGVVIPRQGPPAEPVRVARRPEPARDLPVLGTPGPRAILQIAWDHCIPVLEIGRLRHPACLTAISELQPELLCVACFPQLLPPELLAVPRFGCLNVHPSLLPAHRGPSPLFWSFRRGDPVSGVSVHWTDEGIDTGDLVAQDAIPIPEGISGAELQRECSERGARLLLEVVRAVGAGTAPRRPQPPGGHYETWPAPEDFIVPTSRPARWAYNFIRGVAAWGRPIIEAGGEPFPVRAALGYDERAMLGANFRVEGDVLMVQFAPGVVRVKL